MASAASQGDKEIARDLVLALIRERKLLNDSEVIGGYEKILKAVAETMVSYK